MTKSVAWSQLPIDDRETRIGSLEEALAAIEIDAHYWSDRPCMTCRPISRLLGRAFGCYAYAERTIPKRRGHG